MVKNIQGGEIQMIVQHQSKVREGGQKEQILLRPVTSGGVNSTYKTQERPEALREKTLNKLNEGQKLIMNSSSNDGFAGQFTFEFSAKKTFSLSNE